MAGIWIPSLQGSRPGCIPPPRGPAPSWCCNARRITPYPPTQHPKIWAPASGSQAPPTSPPHSQVEAQATGDQQGLGSPTLGCLGSGSHLQLLLSNTGPSWGACVSAEKVFASLPQVERGVSKILGGDPKGNNFLYTNGKCVILRNIDVSILACFPLSPLLPPCGPQLPLPPPAPH